MVRCWTCGTKCEQTIGDLYICESCEDISNHIRSLQEDVKYASDRVSGKFDDLIHEQRQGFNVLSGGIQDIAGGMHEIASGVQDMTGGMYEIASAIEWGFGELSWQMQQHNSMLQEITAILKTPSETQAEDWRLMAEELRRREEYDKSIEFFLKALNANPLDYRIYIGLAETYLRIRQFDNAKAYFEKSLPHAPSSGIFTYKSYSLRFIGHIHYCREDHDRAIESLSKAIELSPSYTKAHYDLAQYYAVTGDAKRAIPLLQKVIEKDSIYFNLAEREKNFNPIRDAVLQLLEDIKQDAYEKTQKAITNVEDALTDAEDSQATAYALREYGAAKVKLVLAKDRFDSGVYNSIIEAKPMALDGYELAITAKKVALDLRQEIEKVVEEKKAEKLGIEDTNQNELNKANNIAIFIFLGLIFIFMSGILRIFSLYLLGAFLSGIGCAFYCFCKEREESRMEGIFIGIIGFFLAPFSVFALPFMWGAIRSDIHTKYTKQLDEWNEKYRRKIEGQRYCELGNGISEEVSYSALDWLNRGRSCAESKFFDAAISCFDIALGLDPENDEVWVNKGVTLEDLGKFREAVSCYDKALKINPEHKMAREYKEACLQKL